MDGHNSVGTAQGGLDGVGEAGTVDFSCNQTVDDRFDGVAERLLQNGQFLLIEHLGFSVDPCPDKSVTAQRFEDIPVFALAS